MNYIQDGFPEDGDEHLPDVIFETQNLQGMFIGCKYPSTFVVILHRLAALSLSQVVEPSVKPKSFVKALYPEDAEIDVVY